MNILIMIILLPLLGSIFVLSAKDNKESFSKNAFSTALLTLLVNTALVLSLCAYIGKQNFEPFLVYHLSWAGLHFLDMAFRADTFNVLFILGIQVSSFVAIMGLKNETGSQKMVLFYFMLYLSCLNGYFLAQDVLSFYLFFAGQIFPLYMMMGFHLNKKQNKSLLRLALHCFFGSMLFLASSAILLDVYHQDIIITEISNIHLNEHQSILVWGGIFLAFVLRMPIWPFHNALTSVGSLVKNPLVLMSVQMLPLTGLYGFVCYWPLKIPFEISILSPVFQILCIMTMIFVAFSSYSYMNTQHKLYAYMFVFDLLYLLAVFLPTDTIKLNIGYSVFALLLISVALSVLNAHLDRESFKSNGRIEGFLSLMDKASMAYVLFILAAIGLPVSAFFWNNFIIVSEIFNFSLYGGIFVVIAITISGISLLKMLYELENQNHIQENTIKVSDIDISLFVVLLFVMASLLLSFVKPLWFFF